MTKHWLAGVLRVRQVQEDVAKQRRAAAEHAATRARIHARRESERLAGMTGIIDSVEQYRTTTAFVAASVSLQAAAATHSAAEQAVVVADDHVDGRRRELNAAARSRRTVEQLHEQHLEEQRRAERTSAQRDLDEVAARLATENTADAACTPDRGDQP